MDFRDFYFGTVYHPERYPHDTECLAKDAELMGSLHMNAAILSKEAISYAMYVGGGAGWLLSILDLLGESKVKVGIEIPESVPSQELLGKLDADERVFFFLAGAEGLIEAAQIVRALKAAGVKKTIAVQLRDHSLFHCFAEQDEADLICFSHPEGFLGEDMVSAGSRIAFLEDRIRSVKMAPFFLMGVDPMFTTCEQGRKLRVPGTLSLELFQSAIHGARGCFLSDLRQAVSGPKRYDGAVIAHSGRTDTRVVEEVEQIGRLFKELTEVSLTKVDARCAVLCGSDGSRSRAFRVWRSLRSLGLSVDVIDGGSELGSYSLVVACGFRRVSEEAAGKIRRYIEEGGVFVAEWGFATEEVDGTCYTGDVPHGLTDVFGLCVPETEWLYLNEEIPLSTPADFKVKGKHYARSICEIPDNLNADVIAKYDGSFFKGKGALLRKKYGKGFAYYMATDCSDSLLQLLCDKIVNGLPRVAEVKMTEGIAVQRLSGEEAEYLIFQNFLDEEKRLPLDYNKMDIFFGYDPVPAYGVLILQMPRKRKRKQTTTGHLKEEADYAGTSNQN